MSGTARLKPMEGLRGIAVLMVFFVHTHALLGHYVSTTQLLWVWSSFLGSIGNAGVDLFFALSGYLIYGALMRHNTTFIGFVRRRVQRIYPTFLTVFVLYLVLSFVFPNASKLSDRTVPEVCVYVIQNVLLLPGVVDIAPIVTVSWSLSCEMAFYLTVGVLVYITRMWTWAQAYRVVFFAVLWILCAALLRAIPIARAGTHVPCRYSPLGSSRS
jgi:peptidoglycan/LPS O-acetylase OafA/YrhL